MSIKNFTTKYLRKLKVGKDFNFSKNKEIPSSLHRLENIKTVIFMN